MFGRNKDPYENITKLKAEEFYGKFKIAPENFLTEANGTGFMFISNMRILINIPLYNGDHSIFLDNVITFKWTGGMRGIGYKFAIIYSYVNNFDKKGYMTVKCKSDGKKKEITKLLKKYNFYDKPLVIPTENIKNVTSEQKNNSDDPLAIIKTRLAKGEINIEEFEILKKQLN